MAWFALARVLFVAAVAYVATMLHPLPGGALANAGFGLGLSGVVILLESRLRDTSASHVLGALLGGTMGLLMAKAIGAALFWADSRSGRVGFLHSLLLLGLPYLGLVFGGRNGEWLEPARLCRCSAPPVRSGATRCSTPASSSTAASPTSARPASSTAPW